MVIKTKNSFDKNHKSIRVESELNIEIAKIEIKGFNQKRIDELESRLENEIRNTGLSNNVEEFEENAKKRNEVQNAIREYKKKFGMTEPPTEFEQELLDKEYLLFYRKENQSEYDKLHCEKCGNKITNVPLDQREWGVFQHVGCPICKTYFTAFELNQLKEKQLKK